MTRYIAFLRAINVGGHNVKMAELRQHFEELGFKNVETFIASGNVIFEASDTNASTLERKIEAHLHDKLGYAVDTFLRTAAEVAEIAKYEPFPAFAAADAGTLHVALLHAAPSEEIAERLMALQSDVDALHLYNRELYWFCRVASHRSKFSGAVLERALGGPATMRNVNTARRLAKKYG